MTKMENLKNIKINININKTSTKVNKTIDFIQKKNMNYSTKNNHQIS